MGKSFLRLYSKRVSKDRIFFISNTIQEGTKQTDLLAGTGILKGFKVAHHSMKYVNLKESTIKILGIHYSYYKIIENEENFTQHITKI